MITRALYRKAESLQMLSSRPCVSGHFEKLGQRINEGCSREKCRIKLNITKATETEILAQLLAKKCHQYFK